MVTTRQTWVDGVSITFTSTGNPVVITVYAALIGPGNFRVNTRLVRDTTVLFNPTGTLAYGDSTSVLRDYSIVYLDTPGTGSHTYKLQFYGVNPYVDAQHVYSTITCLEVKR